MKALLVVFVCLAAAALLFAQPEPQAQVARPPIIRSLEFKGFQPLTIETLLERLKTKDVRLAVERPFDSQDVMNAQVVLESLLAENGRFGARVKTEVSPMPPHSVRVTLTAVEP